MAAAELRRPAGRAEPGRLLLIAVALTFLVLFLVLPLLAVFVQALTKGISAYWAAVSNPIAWAAVKLTLTVAAIAVPFNLVFGVAAAWAIAKFEFRGKSTLITLIDLPFAVSPVIAGLIFILLFGAHGWFGGFLRVHHIRVVFAVPGIVLATIFVTFPFIARELIPVMQAQGKDDEETALSLGATGWQTFWRVTLPNLRLSIIGAALLIFTLSMDEIAVSFFLIGRDNTLPLEIWGRLRRGITPEINAVSTIIFIFSLAAIVTWYRLRAGAEVKTGAL